MTMDDFGGHSCKQDKMKGSSSTFAKILRQGVTPPTHHNSLSHSYGFFTYDFLFYYLVFLLSTQLF